ncbi:MAG: glycosyl hydrolase family 65 protein, partial [Chloroflexota bacterium]
RAPETVPDPGGGQAVAEGDRALQHPFKIVAFDWDGTAVVNRQSEALAVRTAIEALLELGVYVVVITGTNVDNVDRQLSNQIHGPKKRHLYICTNRGSEVYGFTDDSRPILLWHRAATPEEDRKLTDIADAVRDDIHTRTGLDVAVIYDRLNRRKIDVIPVPEWADPPKSEIGELLDAVERRLRGGGLPGGLREVFRLTREVAHQKGLPEARITSDVKHVEVGLTDKEDSIAWLMRELAAKAGIATEDILIGGDEFGPIAGFEGSDYKTFTPLARGAVYVSVDREPSGTPAGIVHLGGGPDRFVALLEEQVALHRRQAGDDGVGHVGGGVQQHPPVRDVRKAQADPAAPPLRPTDLATQRGWVIMEKGFEPGREHEVESLLTVANGYAGTRGSLAERSRESWPATLIAGVFDKPPEGVTELVVEPDWTALHVYVEGTEVRLFQGETLTHRRLLDMRHGAFVREWRHRDDAGRITRLYYVRFISLADRHAFVETVTLVPENYSATFVVESSLDGRVMNMQGMKHLEVKEASATRTRSGGNGRVPSGQSSSPIVLAARTLQSQIDVVMAANGTLRTAEPLEAAHSVDVRENIVCERWQWEGRLGTTYRFEKLVAAATSRDGPEPERLARAELARFTERGVDDLFSAHARAWEARWADADVSLGGSADDQLAARFAVHHLVQSANPDDERVSVGARGLTGESYKGHVFWDTDTYVIPFYTYTHPAAARSLLTYRYHTLPAARRKARDMGFRGAAFAWESADTGDEVTPSFGVGAGGRIIPILTGQQEHHITADVTYAVWQYWRATGDDDFFLRAGAEILLETARFWASRGALGEDGLYHIAGVIGPDEYHEEVDDNAFTNVMAQWNLERGTETASLLQERWPARWANLSRSLGLAEGEPAAWSAIAAKMYTGFDPESGLYEQFRGYFSLEDIDLAQYEPRTATMEVVIGRERLQRSQIIKQADVVMLLYLLWDRFPAEAREKNFRYYAARCSHGSSLSPSVHALVAARLGDVALARHYFRQAAAIDLANNMGNAAGGIHTACQGGLWQALVFGFGGLTVGEERLSFDPHPLPEWESLAYFVRWRGRQLVVTAGSSPRQVAVKIVQGEPLPIALGKPDGPQATVPQGEVFRASAQGDDWRPEREEAR